MDKLAQNVENPESDLTRSPQMNAVIKEANLILDGEGSHETLEQKINELEMLVAHMVQVYSAELRFQEKTEEFLNEAQIIDENFKALQSFIKELRTWFDNNDDALLEEGIGGCIEAFDHLFASFDRLKEKEENRPVYSKSPYLNEVIRVAECVKKGTLPADAMKQRLDAVIAMQEGFKANLPNMRPTEDERKVLDDNRDKMLKAIDDSLAGYKEARKYFEDFNIEHIDSGLEKAGKATDYLLEVEELLKKAREAPKVKLCFKCGAENPRTTKYCIKCNFKFPPLHFNEGSTIDVRIEEDGIKQTDHIMTENTMKLAAAVEDIKAHKITYEEFFNVLRWFGELLDKGKQDAEQLKMPEGADQETREAFEKFRAIFYQGFNEVEEGLTKLFLFPETKDPSVLQVGMELIMTGGDKLAHLQITAQQIEAAYKAEMNNQAQPPVE